jgi:hypothetical protein
MHVTVSFLYVVCCALLAFEPSMWCRLRAPVSETKVVAGGSTPALPPTCSDGDMRWQRCEIAWLLSVASMLGVSSAIFTFCTCPVRLRSPHVSTPATADWTSQR